MFVSGIFGGSGYALKFSTHAVILGDALKEVTDAVVRVGAGQLSSAVHWHVLNALVGLVVELAVHWPVLLVD